MSNLAWHLSFCIYLHSRKGMIVPRNQRNWFQNPPIKHWLLGSFDCAVIPTMTPRLADPQQQLPLQCLINGRPHVSQLPATKRTWRIKLNPWKRRKLGDDWVIHQGTRRMMRLWSGEWEGIGMLSCTRRRTMLLTKNWIKNWSWSRRKETRNSKKKVPKGSIKSHQRKRRNPGSHFPESKSITSTKTRVSSPSMARRDSIPEPPETTVSYRPFKKLLDGIVFAIR